jgi:integrase
VTRADIQRLHQNRHATPTEANRALALLSTVFICRTLGRARGRQQPASSRRRFPQKRRERFLSADEMGRLGDALSAYHDSPYAVAAVKLLIFTGARLGEVLGLRWEWIDFERGEARLPDSKTGAKTLHLPPPALDVLLRSVPRLEGEPHVLGGKRHDVCRSTVAPHPRAAGLMTYTFTICAMASPAWRRRAEWACRSLARCSATRKHRQPSAMRSWRAIRSRPPRPPQPLG